MVTVEDGTVGEQQSVVVVHSVLWRSSLWPSSEATLLQEALWGQAGLLCGHSAPENLQPGGLDPDPVLDHPDQTGDSAAAQQNHLEVSWMSCSRVEGDQSDTQADEPVKDHNVVLCGCFQGILGGWIYMFALK